MIVWKELIKKKIAYKHEKENTDIQEWAINDMQHKTLQTSQNTFRSFPFLYEFLGGATSERTACLNLNRSEHYPKRSLTALLIFIWASLFWIHTTPYGHISVLFPW